MIKFNSLFIRALVGLPGEPNALPGTTEGPFQSNGLWAGDGSEYMQHENYINEEIGEMGKGNATAYKKIFPFKNKKVRSVDDLTPKNEQNLNKDELLVDTESQTAKALKVKLRELR